MEYKCSDCQILACAKRDIENMPKDCPSLDEELMLDIKTQYIGEIDSKLSHESAMTHIEATERLSRLDETIDFIRRCGYKNIGIAFCKMSKKDAHIVADRLVKEGFTVNSVVCSIGGISDKMLERENETVFKDKGYSTMCNPIGQATLLETSGTQFNILMGLCVGHDTMFVLHSKTPMTVLSIKDRKIGCASIFNDKK